MMEKQKPSNALLDKIGELCLDPQKMVSLGRDEQDKCDFGKSYRSCSKTKGNFSLADIKSLLLISWP